MPETPKVCGRSSSVAPSATPYALRGPSRSSVPPKNSRLPAPAAAPASPRGYGTNRSRAYPGRICSSFARSDAAVSSAVRLTSRSFVPRILTTTFARSRTHRRITVLWVNPSSETVDASSSVRPACVALRFRGVSPAATSKSRGPSGSSRSAPAASVLMSATVCDSSSGSQYSRSRASPSSPISVAARMQMYRRSPSFSISSRYSAGSSTAPAAESSSILGRFDDSGRSSVRVVAAGGGSKPTSKPIETDSAFVVVAAVVRLSAASRSSLSVSEVTIWLRSTSTGAEAPLERNTRMSGGGGGGVAAALAVAPA
mmetsp:Transcript_14243/g.60981  ORF Transcript_14243/g.60981 Transcript_14243/m.60981 type:complete len:313 (-) Transcript_14243:3051-3989(-)